MRHRRVHCPHCSVHYDAPRGLTSHLRRVHGVVLPKKRKRMGVVTLKREARRLVADYMETTGCGCCGDREARDRAGAQLGKLLSVPMYADKSGYDFRKFRTEAGGGATPPPEEQT